MTDVEQFRQAVTSHRRSAGHPQQELARAIGLHPHVFSRKLNGRPGATLTTRDVTAIVTTLAEWGALTTRAEAGELLALLSLSPHVIPASAWSAPPLACLDQDEPNAGSRSASGRRATPLVSVADRAADDPIGPRLLPIPLPAHSTPLIGRLVERDAIRAAFSTSRLVTLTGTGGAGKTRISLHVARELAPTFSDGVAFVDLAPIRDSALLPTAILQALGAIGYSNLPPEDRLSAALRQAHLLLVIDNLEHLVEDAPLLGRLLSVAPSLHILATSRISLRLYGEYEIRVPPLRLPGAGDPAESEAVQLFLQRAQAVCPGFDPSAETLSAIGAICTALDGLPLAIELAAARLKLFPPEALLPQLNSRLSLLTGGPRNVPDRQQTLRAALDWSYALLSPDAQTLFAHLGVFAGSFDAAAAAANLDQAAAPMLGRLAELADHSLLEVIAGATPCFRLLETLREYALARLAESGELEIALERHAWYFLHLAEDTVEPELSPSEHYVDLMERERDNLRAAMAWARDEGEAELGLRLLCAHRQLWVVRGHCVEGQRRAEEMLEIEGTIPSLLRCRALAIAGTMARLRGDAAGATEHLDKALALACETANDEQIAEVCLQLGVVATMQDDWAQARRLFEEGLRLMRATGNARGIATATHLLARLALCLNHLERARMLWEESLIMFQDLGNHANSALVLLSLGWVAARQGELGQAKTYLLEGLTLGERVGYAAISWCFLENGALVAVLEGHARHAAQFLAAADAARAESGEVLDPPEQADVQRMVEEGRAQIGEAEWDEAWREGREMSLEHVVALAKAHATGQCGEMSERLGASGQT